MKKTIKRFSISFIAVLMLVAYTFSAFQVSAAETDIEDTGYSWGVELDRYLTMDVGANTRVYGTTTYSDDCVTKVDITNTNNRVISYYRTGLMDANVTAIAPGTTTLTIAVTCEYYGPNFTYDMKYDVIHYHITVNQKSEVKVSKVKLNKSSATIYKGKTLKLKATVSPSNAKNKKITWSSSKKSVATVSSKGVVTGKKAGTATITAKSSNGKKATCKVKVKNNVAVKKVKLNKKSANIYVGKTLKLKATISPSNASNKKVTWSSSNKRVATVNSKGVVKGKKAGTATITAKSSNGKKATCKVKVKNVAVKKVKLNKKSAKIYVGKTLKLKATISPSNATNKKITWSSSNKSVATVSSKGVVKGKKAGTATITAKASNGKKATCKITVVKNSDPYLANFNKLREYIKNNYDESDETGKSINMNLVDPDGDEWIVSICLLPDNSLSFYGLCAYGDSDNPKIIFVQFSEVDFSKGYSVDASVAHLYNGEIDFASNYVFNAKSYNFPMDDKSMQIVNNTGRFSDAEIIEYTDIYINYALSGFDFLLKERVGLSIQDIGFVNY